MTLLEICVESAEGALAAAAAGAGRIELCAELSCGGVTPSVGTVAVTRASVDLPLMVLLRPRAGDFCYSPLEFAAMAADIDVLKASGVDGVVLGALTPQATLDIEPLAQIIIRARPLSVTFHRAFDLVRDAGEALAALRELGVERVLSSGGAARAIDGAARLAELSALAGPSLSIMPGGGVRAEHVAALVAATGCTEVHSSAGTLLPSPMAAGAQGAGPPLATLPPPGPHQRRATDAAEVAAMVAALSAGSSPA